MAYLSLSARSGLHLFAAAVSLLAALDVLPVALVNEARAQVSPQFIPETRRRRPPLPEPPPPVEPGFELPARPYEPAFELPPPSGPRIFVQEYRFEGNTVIPTEALREVAAPYLGRPVAIEELEQLRRDLSRLYVDQGYINSGALLPEQDVVDGIVRYVIVEGALSEIIISGTEGLDPDYIIERVRLGTGPPLNVNELGDRFRILLQDPLIERLNGRIVPGLRRGQADLELDVERERPWDLLLVLDNHRNPSIGEIQGTFDLTFRNLSGFGEAYHTIFQRTAGAWAFRFDVTAPVTARDTSVLFAIQADEGEVIEEPFELLDIHAEDLSLEAGVRQPVFRTPTDELALGFLLDYEQSETFLLGEPFTFANSGAVDGKSVATVIRFPIELTHRGFHNALAARSTLSVGIDAFNATTSTERDAQFLAWLGQLQWVRRLNERGDSMILQGSVQLTNDSLISLEKCEVGGATTVRGYRENTFVRDQCAQVSLEGRAVVTRFGWPALDIAPDGGVFALAPFVDYGRGWNHGETANTIASIGIGGVLDLAPLLHARLYYAHRLRDPELDPNGSLQDEGIHFQLVLNL